MLSLLLTLCSPSHADALYDDEGDWNGDVYSYSWELFQNRLNWDLTSYAHGDVVAETDLHFEACGGYGVTVSCSEGDVYWYEDLQYAGFQCSGTAFFEFQFDQPVEMFGLSMLVDDHHGGGFLYLGEEHVRSFELASELPDFGEDEGDFLGFQADGFFDYVGYVHGTSSPIITALHQVNPEDACTNKPGAATCASASPKPAMAVGLLAFACTLLRRRRR